MRAFHIIPSAFDYFNDIRAAAFALVEELSKLGVSVEVNTMQYTAPTREEKVEVRSVAPSRHYAGTTEFTPAAPSFTESEITHLHAPFLGGAGVIYRWKKANPGIPFVVSYYRDVPFTDLISLYVRWYNSYYLPRLFGVADAVACFSAEDFARSAGAGFLRDKNKLAELDGAIHLTSATADVQWDVRRAAENLAALYDKLRP